MVVRLCPGSLFFRYESHVPREYSPNSTDIDNLGFSRKNSNTKDNFFKKSADWFIEFSDNCSYSVIA